MNSLTVADWDNEANIQLLRETYAKDLNKKQFAVYLEMAKAQDLNPFTKEIYGIIVGGKPVLITSIAGFRKIAHRSGCYAGCKVDVEYKNDKPYSARAVVKKIVQGQTCEFEAEVMFKEFAGINQWKTRPVQMIKKVAESHALRMAFPSLQNTYEESEVAAMKNVGPKSTERTEALNERFAKVEAVEVPEFIELEDDEQETTVEVEK